MGWARGLHQSGAGGAAALGAWRPWALISGRDFARDLAKAYRTVSRSNVGLPREEEEVLPAPASRPGAVFWHRSRVAVNKARWRAGGESRVYPRSAVRYGGA